MKYIKKFNEELDPSTYKRAANKLDKLGLKKRSKEMMDYYNTKMSELQKNKWRKLKDTYSKYGLFDFHFENSIFDDHTNSFDAKFHLIIEPVFDIIEDDIDLLPDEFEREPNWSEKFIRSPLMLDITLIPESEEIANMFYNKTGGYNITPVRVDINLNFYKNDIIIDSLSVEKTIFYEEYVLKSRSEFKCHLSTRQSAGRFKNLLRDIFNGKSDYPVYATGKNLYKELTGKLLMEFGLSSDYGFTLETISDYINKISPNTLYKES